MRQHVADLLLGLGCPEGGDDVDLPPILHEDELAARARAADREQTRRSA